MANVLVTGTSTGIGFSTALTLARAGHSVYAAMRNPSKAPLLGETAAKEKLPIRVVVMDVDSDDSVKEAIAGVHKDAGQIDVLINNAGVERNGSIEELPLSDFRLVMETNYFGPIRCTQAVVPQMRKRKSGCIINVSSVAGHISNSPMAPYTASKFALEALSEVLAQEMKTFNVHVAIVEPASLRRRWRNDWRRDHAILLTVRQNALLIYLSHPLRIRRRRLWWRIRFAKSSRAGRGSCGIRSALIPRPFWIGANR
jgi:NAD(P)-dependent dehydrogenase (short-subunit alcohol dehydrogenase family)